MHSFDGEYDLWLVGGVVVFGKLQDRAQTIYSSADSRTFPNGGKVVNVLRHAVGSRRYGINVIV